MTIPSLEDQLVSELWARDVQFLMGRQFSSTPLFAPAKRHQILSEHTINWLGTYEYAAERFIRHMEKIYL